MKKTILFFFLMIFLNGMVSACQRDMLKPETKPKIISLQQETTDSGTVQVYSQAEIEFPSLYVRHETKGNQVLVECILKGISFREADFSNKKVGKILVWIDGKRTREVSSAAFIIKGLSPGSHKVKLEVVKLNHESYGLIKEFMVNIP